MTKNTIFGSDNGKPKEIIKTKIIGYYFRLDDKKDFQAWENLKAERKESGVELFDVIEMKNDSSGSGENRVIELETKHLFNNQWNTKDGLRVFDWIQSIVPNKRIKIGHYLIVNDEMREIRQNAFSCGYCGAQYYGEHNENKFCYKCLGGEHLKENDIYLLRLQSVADGRNNRAKLTQAESDVIMPLYIENQISATSERIKKANERKRKQILSDFESAEIEKDGFLWMLDKNINIEDVIYYKHKNTFCVGWHGEGISENIKNEWQKALKDFPYNIEYKVKKVSHV
ncbi:MAG: hypothetical protein ACKVQK_31465 [Burkholderiales bacterium]